MEMTGERRVWDMSTVRVDETGQAGALRVVTGGLGVHVEAKKAEVPAVPMEMPASAERAAKDIADIGVEGRPADAKSGPGMLRLEMLGMLAALVVVAVLVGFFAGWVLGGAMFVIGFLALLFNPVMGATAYRERDRREAVEREQRSVGKSARKL